MLHQYYKYTGTIILCGGLFLDTIKDLATY